MDGSQEAIKEYKRKYDEWKSKKENKYCECDQRCPRCGKYYDHMRRRVRWYERIL